MRSIHMGGFFVCCVSTLLTGVDHVNLDIILLWDKLGQGRPTVCYTKTMKIIGITGGSGSGKSTLAMALAEKYSDDVCFLSLDDYFKNSTNMEEDGSGTINWDSPEAIDFERLYSDITDLKNGKSISLLSKSRYYNLDFDYNSYQKIEITVEPKDILITEGFMLLHDKRIRDLIDHKIYLDMSISESIRRRDNTEKNTPDNEYLENYLIPNHKKNVEKAREHADLIVDAKTNNAEETLGIVTRYLSTTVS